MDALTCLTTRRSVRQFSGAPLPPEAVRAVVEAGRQAPTANNQQVWTFVSVTERARLAELRALCPKNAPFLDGAGLAVLVSGRGERYLVEDGSAAATNMLNALHALGYGGCWVAGHGKDYGPAVMRWAGAPEGQQLLAIVVGGVAAGGSPQTPKKALAEIWRRESFAGEAGQ